MLRGTVTTQETWEERVAVASAGLFGFGLGIDHSGLIQGAGFPNRRDIARRNRATRRDKLHVVIRLGAFAPSDNGHSPPIKALSHAKTIAAGVRLSCSRRVLCIQTQPSANAEINSEIGPSTLAREKLRASASVANAVCNQGGQFVVIAETHQSGS